VRLEDDAILLRPFGEDDVPAIVAACQDPEIPRWTHVPSPYTEEDARAFLARSADGSFAITDAQTGELLGAIGLHRVEEGIGQIGYWVVRAARGRGVATRALRLISRWGFEELGLPRLQLLTEPENTPSQRVAEKAGFQREGLLRAYAVLKGRRPDFYMYSLLPGDV
jgi:RimJ/RimL family protein N-acetyltransferase